MTAITIAQGATWAIAAFAAGGVIARPWKWPEAIWAVLGAATLVALPWCHGETPSGPFPAAPMSICS